MFMYDWGAPMNPQKATLDSEHPLPAVTLGIYLGGRKRQL
jgi:hypothetical protein